MLMEVFIYREIFTTAGSPVEMVSFLNRDEVGIRWVSFEPSFTEGVFVQDEGQVYSTNWYSTVIHSF